MRKSIVRLLTVASLALPGLALAQAGAAALKAQTSSARGVTIKVTPKNLFGGVATWEFTVALDTHSGSLSDDLMKTAQLLDGTGGRHAPLAWEGAPPGGHHRSGVLRFNPVLPLPQTIELRIDRPGEPEPRSFRWQPR